MEAFDLFVDVIQRPRCLGARRRVRLIGPDDADECRANGHGARWRAEHERVPTSCACHLSSPFSLATCCLSFPGIVFE
jgi:hypothetical protein